MRLYRVTNGYMGNGDVHVLVIADTTDRARELAREVFRREGDAQYGSSYWDDLSVEQVASDTSTEWVGDVED